ncbi:MAG: GNAT family N-acetyltransferase [Victivallaceae bacterium]|nr:GNAT family N-acetyltransferase [Victivallaceae bacterium]
MNPLTFAGKAARRLYRRNRDYVIVPDPAAALSAAETYLAAGECFTKLTQEMIDDALEQGRMSYAKAAGIAHLLRSNQWMVAVVNGRENLLGWCFVSLNHPTGSLGGLVIRPNEEYVYKHDTFVLPDSRGRRLGAAINLHVMEAFADRKMFCLVRTNNTPALANWKRCGARSIARITESRIIGCGWRQKVERLATPAEADPYLDKITFKR